MEGFRELHNNKVPKKHDSQNNTPLNITPLTHVPDGLYIECPPRGKLPLFSYDFRELHKKSDLKIVKYGYIKGCPK
jgi:hypothetical protein